MTTVENAFKYVNTKATLSYLVASIGSLARKCTKWRNLCITVVTRLLISLDTKSLPAHMACTKKELYQSGK